MTLPLLWRRVSVKQKLRAIIMLTVAAALLLAAGRGRTGRALNLELAHNRVHFQINPNAAELAGIVHGGAQ